MPFIPHTPESKIPRSDSKNPSTTCQGLTASGRPCRRSLAASPKSSPSPNGNRGVCVVLPNIDSSHNRAAAFFCWQHVEQANGLADDEHAGQSQIVHLKERSSIDTLVNRIGVLDIEADSNRERQQKTRQTRRPIKRETLPQPWQNVPGPLMAVPEGTLPGRALQKPTLQQQTRQRSKGNSTFTLSFFCCMRQSSAEYENNSGPARPHRKSTVLTDSVSTIPKSKDQSLLPLKLTTKSQDNTADSRRQPNPVRPSESFAEPPGSRNRPFVSRDPSSHTQTLLSMIPTNLPPHLTSLLLSELAKPIGPPDKDLGYIYMFWLTRSTAETPGFNFVSSLIDSTPLTPTSQVGKAVDTKLDRAESYAAAVQTSKTVLLKIGRASNVQRRMNEWTRQCNYNLSVIRYYPQFSSQALPSNPIGPLNLPLEPRKMPNTHRVERLIHIELAEQRVRRLCTGCGKEHREWFEVEASRKGLRKVDEVIKRWVAWGERMNS